MISKEEVEHIAKLARLDLKKEEIKKMQKDLSSILNYIDSLKAAKISETFLEIGKKKNKTSRQDLVRAGNESSAKKLIDASPDKKENYIKVKAIF